MKRLSVVALMVLVTLVGMVGFSRAGNELSALQATANTTSKAVGTLQATVNDGVPARAKMYYLTVNGFTGGDAMTACDSGFHMASISEIQDPGNLQYAAKGTPAYDVPYDQVYGPPSYDAPAYDQGLGPPSNRMGWVRTGAYQQTDYEDSCDMRQSSSDQQSSTTMSQYSFFFYTRPVQHMSAPLTWWHLAHQTCASTEPVWCVENPQ